ncbi:MAG: GIY-YIG nuclease family protein [Pseudohongiella sp.]|nr:GIY-YIG nuclease family protein [Pseudohongiella sp.]
MRPATPDGYLYYVRLKTEYGIFYKIGFTKLQSVEARLNFGGNADVRHIDKVLAFVYFKDAYDIEQRLHEVLRSQAAFGSRSHIPELLLAGNGQTELYSGDVLQLDRDYTDQQKEQTREKLYQKMTTIKGRNGISRSERDGLFDVVFSWTFLIVAAAVVLVIMLIRALLFRRDAFAQLRSAFTDPFRKKEKQAEQKENDAVVSAIKIKILKAQKEALMSNPLGRAVQTP